MESIFSSNGLYGAMGNGMTYANQQAKETNWTNALSAEEEKELHRSDSGVSIDIPKERVWQAKCTHRDPKTRQFTLRENPDGTVTCLKCGSTFNLIHGVSMEEITKVIGGAIDILETMKTAYVDMTPQVIQTYFIILPFLEIAPKLYEAAMKTLNEVGVTSMGVTGNYSPSDMFNSLYTAMGNVGMMNPAVMQGGMPMMQGQIQMPAMQGASMNPPGGVVYNPMQTGSVAMPGVAETVTNPTPAPPIVQQAQPKEGQTVQVSKQFKLD